MNGAPVDRSLPGPFFKALRSNDPAMRFLFSQIRARRMRMTDLADISGLSLGTLENWSQGKRNPTVQNLRAALNAIGFDLAIVDKFAVAVAAVGPTRFQDFTDADAAVVRRELQIGRTS